MERAASRSDVERLNDQFAREYDIDAYYEQSGFAIRFVERSRLRRIRAMVAPTRGERLLEVGCGGGHVLRLFPEAKLTGVDVSGVMIEKARRNLAAYDVTLLKGELHELNLPSARFDKVICSEVLEHVFEPLRMLGEMRRLLRPGGWAVITLPNDQLIDRIKRLIASSPLSSLPSFGQPSWGGDQYHLHRWTLTQMRRLVGQFFRIEREAFAPSRLVPIRCCFLCLPSSRTRA